MSGRPLRDDLNLVAAYLARRDLPGIAPGSAPPADVLVLCGSAVLAAVDVAASAFSAGLAERLVVTGGVGHSTRYLQHAVRTHPLYRDTPTTGRTESAVIADILREHHGVPDAALQTEAASANCGENAAFTVDLLRRQPAPWRSILVIQDPTMQRRTHECFRRSLRPDRGVDVRSYAPFVPVVSEGRAGDVQDGQGRTAWPLSRFTALLLGEIRRLHDDEAGYGPRGADFIDHVDIPAAVLDAYHRLAAAHPTSTRDTWRP